MQFAVDFLNFISGLGPAIMMPIVIIIIGILFRVKFSTLLESALMTGVGFYGVNLVINSFTGVMGPIAQSMVNNWGLSTDIIDVGWPARAAATWSFSLAGVVVFVVLGVNVLMLILKATRCVMVDFWSYNHFVVAAALVYGVTGSAIAALIAAALDAIIAFKLADWTQPLCEETFGIEDVSFPTSNSVGWAPLAYVLNKLWDLIPFIKNSKADPKAINDRFGVLGKPLLIGIIIGTVIALLAGVSAAQVLTAAITTGATMVITPKMMQIVMQGMLPFAESIKKILNSKFKGAKFHIGVDAALTVTNESVIAIGVLMVPITLVLAMVLPYNRLLPISDIAYQAMWLAAWPVAFGKGNVIKGLLSTIVITCIMLFIATSLAQIHTALAVAGGFTMPAGVALISTEDMGTHLIEYIMYAICKIFVH